MNATRRVKRKRSERKRAAIPRTPSQWPPKLPPLSVLETHLFDEPEPPDCEDEWDPPGWPHC
jgi:hypothetical protein